MTDTPKDLDGVAHPDVDVVVYEDVALGPMSRAEAVAKGFVETHYGYWEIPSAEETQLKPLRPRVIEATGVDPTTVRVESQTCTWQRF